MSCPTQQGAITRYAVQSSVPLELALIELDHWMLHKVHKELHFLIRFHSKLSSAQKDSHPVAAGTAEFAGMDPAGHRLQFLMLQCSSQPVHIHACNCYYRSPVKTAQYG